MAKRSPIRDLIRFVSMASTIAYCFGLTSFLSPYAPEGVAGYSSGPTMLGLSAIGVVTGVFMLIFLIRAGHYYLGLSTVPDDKGTAASSSGEAFDADDAIARYLARTEAETVARPVSVVPAPRSGFGRKPG